MSREISPSTYLPACRPFTPSNSGQRLHPTYYRGCWHVVGRCLFAGYRLLAPKAPHSSPAKEVYILTDFIPHAASLLQAFAHRAIFLTAAFRRSLDRVSVPVWLIVLSDQLPIVDLVGRYPANYLMGRRPILRRFDLRRNFSFYRNATTKLHRVLVRLSAGYSRSQGRLPTCYSPVRRFTRDIATPFSQTCMC